MSKQIEAVLVEYSALVQQRTVLAEMLRRLHSVTETDIIDTITFGRKIPHEDGIPPRVTGSPELYMTGFREAFLKRYQKDLDACMVEYHSVDMKISLMESAVAALPEHYSKLIEGIYFRHLTWDSIAVELHISRRTIANQRKKALVILEQIWERYEGMLL